MARYLLDSDVLIWILRNRRETVTMADHLVTESGEAPACSALSVLEIWGGAKSTEVSKTAALLDAMDVVAVTGDIARQAAELLRTHQRPRGSREWVDAIIAATAIHRQLVLVTYNQRDYPYRELTLYPMTS